MAGIGTYTTTVNLPSVDAGAYFNLDAVRDTSSMVVKGQTVAPYDYADENRIDLAPPRTRAR